MKAVIAFFFGSLLCAAQKPANCWDSREHVLQCLDAGDVEVEYIAGLGSEKGSKEFKQDYEMAAKWYRLAALQGHAGAQTNLGRLYATGQGVPQDYTEAVRWFLMAAKSGNAVAQTMTGNMYLEGHGVRQDYAVAADWFWKAAEQGEVGGQVMLGLAYEAGNGVPQDYVLAHMWLNLAGAQGETRAMKWRDRVATKMTPAQIAEAQRLAREFKAKVP
jgi:uncharacterized protein